MTSSCGRKMGTACRGVSWGREMVFGPSLPSQCASVSFSPFQAGLTSAHGQKKMVISTLLALISVTKYGGGKGRE